MKAIIKNGVANKDIQSCLISECGVEITFHNNDLADKFALSLNLSGIPCVNNGNKITISYIDQLSVSRQNKMETLFLLFNLERQIKDIKIPYTLIAQLRFLPRVVNSRFVSCTMVCEDSGTFLI